MTEESEKGIAYCKLAHYFFDNPKMTGQELIEEVQRLNLYGVRYLKVVLTKHQKENHDKSCR